MRPVIAPHEAAHAEIGVATATIRCSPDKRLIPGVCHAFANFAQGGDPMETSKLMLVLRGLLEHVMEQGGGESTSQKVQCEIARQDARSVAVSIGYDAPAAGDGARRRAPWKPGGVELGVVKALCESFHFEDGGRRAVCRVSWHGERGTGGTGPRERSASERKENGL